MLNIIYLAMAKSVVRRGHIIYERTIKRNLQNLDITLRIVTLAITCSAESGTRLKTTYL